MRITAVLSVIGLSVLIYSCSSSPSPTGPQSYKIPHPGLALPLVDYGESLDSAFYKVWSDSSWEAFSTDTTINGTKYTVIVDYTGFENIYGPDGYAGFGQYGSPLIMFDSSLASLPDTVLEGHTYNLQTTFQSQGTSNTFLDQETFLDTATVVTSFGTFSNCLMRQSAISMNGVLQTVLIYWLAKGPSDVARQYQSGAYIVMAYGVVNGQGWGVPLGNSRVSIVAGLRPSASARDKSFNSSADMANEARSMAPLLIVGKNR